MRHRGSCHCGAVEVEFETAVAPPDLPLRACACSFCRRHGARSATDRGGGLWLRFAELDVHRYGFGLRTAEFIVCRHCGVYTAAVMNDVATLNVNVLDERDRFSAAPRARAYDDETREQRVARRRAGWTPVTVVVR